MYHIRTQVTVKQHDGKEDEQGERTAASDTRHDSRRYSVTAGQLIRVTLKNWSKTPLKMIPVYMSDKGDESSFTVLDTIGDAWSSTDPGTSWTVCGDASGTKDHTRSAVQRPGPGTTQHSTCCHVCLLTPQLTDDDGRGRAVRGR